MAKKNEGVEGLEEYLPRCDGKFWEVFLSLKFNNNNIIIVVVIITQLLVIAKSC